MMLKCAVDEPQQCEGREILHQLLPILCRTNPNVARWEASVRVVLECGVTTVQIKPPTIAISRVDRHKNTNLTSEVADAHGLLDAQAPNLAPCRLVSVHSRHALPAAAGLGSAPDKKQTCLPEHAAAGVHILPTQQVPQQVHDQ